MSGRCRTPEVFALRITNPEPAPEPVPTMPSPPPPPKPPPSPKPPRRCQNIQLACVILGPAALLLLIYFAFIMEASPPSSPHLCFISDCGCPDSFKKFWCRGEYDTNVSEVTIDAESCNADETNCEKDCNGKWCPIDFPPSPPPPLPPAPQGGYLPPPSPPPPSTHLCFYSDCGCPDSFEKTWCQTEFDIGLSQVTIDAAHCTDETNCERDCNGKWCPFNG